MFPAQLQAKNAPKIQQNKQGRAEGKAETSPAAPTKYKLILPPVFLLSRYFSLSSFEACRRAWISSCAKRRQEENLFSYSVRWERLC